MDNTFMYITNDDKQKVRTLLVWNQPIKMQLKNYDFLCQRIRYHANKTLGTSEMTNVTSRSLHAKKRNKIDLSLE